MPRTISKLRRRQRIALTQAERKFDTSGGKSLYGQDPRNIYVDTRRCTAALRVRAPSSGRHSIAREAPALEWGY